MPHRLILVRHAKAGAAGASDAVRELTVRGERQSDALGGILDEAVRGRVHALVSSAVRAVQTWRLAAARITTEVTTEQLDSLYIADAEDVLAEVRASDESIDTVVVVGHNPTIAEVAAQLVAGGTGSAYDELSAGGYSPCTATLFDLTGSWAQADGLTAHLAQYVPPQA